MITIDIETTGLSKKDCGICQLSMVKTNDNFEVIDTFNHYIKPKPSALWNQGAMNCSGITPEMVADCPYLADLADEILEFIGDEDILTYNGNSFDIPFLQEELKSCGRNLILSNRKIYDSYYIESIINPRKLTSVYKKYTGKDLEGAHNSLNDVMATLEVFKHQAEILNINDCLSANTFGGVIGKDDNGEYVFMIGKYRGQHIPDVIKNDPKWVAWLLKEKQDNEFFLFIKKFYEELKK